MALSDHPASESHLNFSSGEGDHDEHDKADMPGKADGVSLIQTEEGVGETESEDGISSKVLEFIGISKSYRHSLYNEYVPDAKTITNIPYSLVNWFRGNGIETESIMEPRDGNETETDFESTITSLLKEEATKAEETEDDETVKAPEAGGDLEMQSEKVSSTITIEDTESTKELKEILKIGKAGFFVKKEPESKEVIEIEIGGKSDGEDMDMESESEKKLAEGEFPELKKIENDLMDLQDLFCSQVHKMGSETNQMVYKAQVVTSSTPSKFKKSKSKSKHNKNENKKVYACTSETSIYRFIDEDDTDADSEPKEETRERLHRKRVTFATPPSETNIYAYHEIDSDADDEEDETQEEEEEQQMMQEEVEEIQAKPTASSTLGPSRRPMSPKVSEASLYRSLAESPSMILTVAKGKHVEDQNGNDALLLPPYVTDPPSKKPSKHAYDLFRDPKAPKGNLQKNENDRRKLEMEVKQQVKGPSPMMSRKASLHRFDLEKNGNNVNESPPPPRRAINVPSRSPSRIPVPVPERPSGSPDPTTPQRTHSLGLAFTKTEVEFDENANEVEFYPLPPPPLMIPIPQAPAFAPLPVTPEEIDDTDTASSSEQSEDSSISSYYDYLVESETQTDETGDRKKISEPILNKKVTFANIPEGAGTKAFDANNNLLENNILPKAANSLPIILKTSSSPVKKESLPVVVVNKADKEKLAQEFDIVKNVFICINIQTTPSDKEDSACFAEPTEPYSSDERNDYTRPTQRHTLVVSPRMIDSHRPDI